jgi:phosphonopyruvate decarboxylase
MIDAEIFLSRFLDVGLNHFTGVPDSTFKPLMTLLENKEGHFINRIAANEGAAIAHAAGYYLATKKLSVVYFQNSGLGNAINPLTSLTDSEVYSIPMLIIIGWRGRPGLKDEPQHKKMGAITIEILETLGISHNVLSADKYQDQINNAKLKAETTLEPCVLIIEPGFFQKISSKKNQLPTTGIIRETAIEIIVNSISVDDIIVSTTGKTSRELYEVCSQNGRGHSNNFYNVGSMGHVSAIGLEIALQNNNNVYILDGDGAMIMHMGSLATIGHYHPKNLTHIIFDNNSHESTGGQPTVSETIDIPSVLKACNYQNVSYIKLESELSEILKLNNDNLKGLVIQTKKGSRDDLGRPTDSPQKTKVRFMEEIANGK